MAVRCSIAAPLFFIQTPSSTKRSTTITTLLLRASNHVAANSASPLIKSCSRMPVFEDRSKGIVCYRDVNGEITCEGFDEGPRFQDQNSRFTFNRPSVNLRETEIIDLFQNWVQSFDGGFN